MSTSVQALADVVVPTPFTEYSSANTKVLSAFASSGILSSSEVLRQFLLSDGGQLLTKPSWKDLDDDAPRISTDGASPLYTAGFGTAFPAPAKVTTFSEVAVRLNRNMHWTSQSLITQLAGSNAFNRIGERVSAYWARHLQATVLAILAGVFADNDAAPTGGDTHTQGDLTFDVSNLAGGSFQAGLTNFTAEALFDAMQTAGDAKAQFTHLAVHSAVHNRMKKNNLIDFIQDSVTGATLETFQGLILTMDDQMPKTGQVYSSYLFRPGALEWSDAVQDPTKATEVVHRPESGNGAGSDELWNRIQWCIHPMGHAFLGTVSVAGGPDNTASANMLAAAASWSRRTPERKQVGLARLITREG